MPPDPFFDSRQRAKKQRKMKMAKDTPTIIKPFENNAQRRACYAQAERDRKRGKRPKWDCAEFEGKKALTLLEEDMIRLDGIIKAFNRFI